MAGLMDGQQGQAPSGEPPAAPDTVGDHEGSQPTPEEQAQYEAFVKSGIALIYEGGEIRPMILEMLDEDPKDLIEVLPDANMDSVTPATALGATAAIIVLEMVSRAGENRPSDDIIAHAGKEIVEILANDVEKMGVREYTEQEMTEAYLKGVDLYREAATAAGFVDTEALKAQFDEIVSADKEGRLGDVLPQLAKAEVRQPAAEGETDGRVA